MSEKCKVKPGSLACEECDEWVVVRIIERSEKYPLGYAVQRCKLDLEKERTVPLILRRDA